MLRHARVVLVTSIIIVITGIGTMLALLMLWRPSAIDAFVPTDKTIAVFQGMDTVSVHAYDAAFPILTTLPQELDGMDIALVENEHGAIAWIAAPAEGSTIDLPGANVRIGQHRLRASDANVSALLGRPAPLRDDSTYRLLSPGRGGKTTYIKNIHLPQRMETILHLIGVDPKGPMVVKEQNDDSLSLSFMRLPNAVRLGAIDAHKTLPSAAPFVLQAHTMADLFLRIRAQMPETDAARTEAMIAKHINDLSTDTLSLQYDLLPLLQHEAILAYDPHTNHYFLQQSEDTEMLVRAASRMRERTTAGIQTQVTTRSFSKGLGLTTIGLATDQTKNATVSHIGTWMVRDANVSSGAPAVTVARRGDDTVVTNVRNWLEEDMTAVPQGRQEHVVLRLIATPTIVEQLLRDAGSPLWNALWSRFSKASRISIDIVDSGDALRVTIRPL
jgi:hypothetical protein